MSDKPDDLTDTGKRLRAVAEQAAEGVLERAGIVADRLEHHAEAVADALRHQTPIPVSIDGATAARIADQISGRAVAEHELHCSRIEHLEVRMEKTEGVVNKIRAAAILVPLAAFLASAASVWHFIMELRGHR